MKLKPGKHSLIVSALFSLLCIAALIFIIYWLPEVVDSMIDTADHLGNRSEITATGRFWVLLDAYVMVGLAMIAVFFILWLLRIVYSGAVFSKCATRLLNVLTGFCFAEAVLFALLTPVFQIALCVAIAACLLGLLLRVVTHVIEEAIRIKAENDYTI